MRRTDRYRYPIIMTLLVVLQFTVRSHLGGDRVAPDFLLLALLIYTIRAEPGKSAAAGLRHIGAVVAAGAPWGCQRERVPSTSPRSPSGDGAHGRVDRAGHHGDVVLPHANPRARQVSAAVGDEPVAADSAPRATGRHLRPHRSRDRRERPGLHGIAAARS